MLDRVAVGQMFSVEVAAWSATAILLLFVIRMWNGSPAMFAQWIEWRRLKAAEKASDWTRLRDEIDRLSEAEKACRADHAKSVRDHADTVTKLADATHRIAALEGYYFGQGSARQEAVVAIERLENDNGA